MAGYKGHIFTSNVYLDILITNSEDKTKNYPLLVYWLGLHVTSSTRYVVHGVIKIKNKSKNSKQTQTTVLIVEGMEHARGRNTCWEKKYIISTHPFLSNTIILIFIELCYRSSISITQLKWHIKAPSRHRLMLDS